jgi:hypothetical protein
MGSLGDLGTPRDAVELDFSWFGETIRVHPDASDLRTADFLMEFGDLDMDDETAARRAMEAMSEHLLGQIHPDDRDLFWRLAKDNRQQMADIMAVSKAITEAVAGFPTQRSSGSAPTAPRTGPRSTALASSREQRRREERGGSARRDQVTDSAMGLLKDRPDLRLALVRQREARDAMESEAG